MLAFAQASVQPSQSAPPYQPSDTVLIPRALIAPIEQAILHPHSVDVGDVIALLQQFRACVADNPTNGVVRHLEPDLCSPVTQALAVQAQELAEAKKTATAPPAKPN